VSKNKLISPFLKWVGGKRQVIPEILSHLPKNISSLNYCEPFIGGGALLFHLEPKKAIINDYNDELINVYKVIKNNLEDLLIDLKKHQNTSEYFYQIRSIDRQPLFDELTNVQHASRVIYLNKTCYNGLYRVNSLGEFNSPFGKYTNPNIVNEPVLRAVSKYLNSSDITILNGDYEKVLNAVNTDTFVYLDPPYHPISESSNFTGYVQGGWSENHQIRLKKACDDLDKKGVKFLQSNSSAPFIKKLYSEYKIHSINANRSINSDGEKRGQIEELLIKNY
jgi:DNA adenine methylase